MTDSRPRVFDEALMAEFSAESVATWVVHPKRLCLLFWGNEQAIALWRHETLEELQAREFPDHTGITQRLIDDHFTELCSSDGKVVRMSIFPGGDPIECMLRLGVVELPDGANGLLVRARPVEAIADADESRMNRTLHYLASAVSVFTFDGEQLAQNGTASRWYPARGGSPQSLRERFVDPADCDALLAEVKDKHVHHNEIRMRTAAGDAWHAVAAHEFPDPATGAPALVLDETNIERVRTAEQKLSDALVRLEQAQEQLLLTEKMASLGNLVAGVAHELNTPVGALMSSATTAELALTRLGKVDVSASPTKHSRLLSAVHEAHDVIRNAGERVTEIVTSLRNFARLDESLVQRADLNAELEHTVALASHRLADGTEVVTQFGELPEVLCRPAELNQVFINVLANAAESIDEHMRNSQATQGTITLRTWAKDDEVHIAFEDDGIGVDPVHLAQVFDPGFTKKGVGVGTGLGLSLAYRIVSDHGGRIALASDGRGRGATVTISLPRETTSDQPDPITTSSEHV